MSQANRRRNATRPHVQVRSILQGTLRGLAVLSLIACLLQPVGGSTRHWW